MDPAKGAAFSAAWFIDNTRMPFLWAGIAKGNAALYERSLMSGAENVQNGSELPFAAGPSNGRKWHETDGPPWGQQAEPSPEQTTISFGTAGRSR